MTNGTIVVLGQTGRNFAAGMSGGLAYVFDPNGEFVRFRCNRSGVDLEPIFEREDLARLEYLIRKHVEYTNSPLGRRLLENWAGSLPHFVKVFPHEYKRVLDKGDLTGRKMPIVVEPMTAAVAAGERAG